MDTKPSRQYSISIHSALVSALIGTMKTSNL